MRGYVGTLSAYLGFLFVAAATAQAPPRLVFLEPSGSIAVFQEVQVTVEVVGGGDEVAVELTVDGRSQGVQQGRPYRWTVDVGEENVEHTFRAVVAADGREVPETEALLTTPSIHVEESLELNLEQLYVTVERRGEPVSGLGPRDFKVEDDGILQELVTAAAGKTPFTAVVLLDISISMRGGPLRNALEGVAAFVEGMEPLDEARVAVFAHDLLHATPFSQDPEELSIPMEDLPRTGGTAVYDHLYWALRVVETRFGRPVVILLSDGEDVHSVLDMTAVRETARRSQAMLYWLRLQDAEAMQMDLHNSFRDLRESDRQQRELERAVKESGGRILEVRGTRAIRGALQEVLAELRAQYALGYYPDPPGGDSRWHTLKVQVRGARVRAREGYFAFP